MNLDELNAIASDLNVTPLMQFYSTDTEEAIELMEFEGDPSDAAIPKTEWFEPSDGLKTIQALQRFIGEHPDLVSEATAIKSDLAEFESVLVQAQEHGLRWHLSVDY